MSMGKMSFGLLSVFVLIAAIVSTALTSAFTTLEYKPFNNGWQSQIGKKSVLHSMDSNCPKGMIWARYSDGFYDCAWPSKNNKKTGGALLNVNSGNTLEQEEDVDVVEEEEEEGSSDDGGVCEYVDERRCEDSYNSCEE